MVDEMTKQYRARGDVRVSPASLKLGEMSLQGSRLDVTLMSEHVRQEVYTFTAAGATYSLVIQDSPEDGKPTAETQQAIEMLEKTFDVTQ
jgi:hypothetical protein